MCLDVLTKQFSILSPFACLDLLNFWIWDWLASCFKIIYYIQKEIRKTAQFLKMGCNLSSSGPIPTKDKDEVINNEIVEINTPQDFKEEISSRRQTQNLLQNVVTENIEVGVFDVYKIDENNILGKGLSGAVYKCHHKVTNGEYALKSLKKAKLKKDKLFQLKEEIKIMASLDHPYILRLHESFETKDTIYLVTELCKGGELLNRLQSQKGHRYNEQIACRYVFSMVSAVRYCHSHNIVHRDLKLENFLFEDTSDSSELKLIDFGLGQHFENDEVMHRSVGSPYYVAPEVLKGQYSSKCDVWSLGVIVYMLLSGIPPFYGQCDAEILDAVRRGFYVFHERTFKHISEDAKDFIRKCLTKNAERRPTAAELLDHPWFQSLSSTAGTGGSNDGSSSSSSAKSGDGLCVGEDKDRTIDSDIINRIRGFHNRNPLVRICMEVVAHTLQQPQISELRKEFLKIDASNSGEISIKDLRSVLQGHDGISDSQVNVMFHSLSVDNTAQVVHYHEFLAATMSRQTVADENIRVAFEKISKHRDFITRDDIKDLLGVDATEEEVEKMLIDMNLNPDSKISYNQFGSMLMAGLQTPTGATPFNRRQSKRLLSFWAEDIVEE